MFKAINIQFIISYNSILIIDINLIMFNTHFLINNNTIYVLNIIQVLFLPLHIYFSKILNHASLQQISKQNHHFT